MIDDDIDAGEIGEFVRHVDIGEHPAQNPAGTHVAEHDRPEYSVPDDLERLIVMARQTKQLAGPNNWRHELQPFRCQLHDALVELRSLHTHSPAEMRALWQIEDILEIAHHLGPTDSERLEFVLKTLAGRLLIEPEDWTIEKIDQAIAHGRCHSEAGSQ